MNATLRGFVREECSDTVEVHNCGTDAAIRRAIGQVDRSVGFEVRALDEHDIVDVAFDLPREFGHQYRFRRRTAQRLGKKGACYCCAIRIAGAVE